MTNSEPRMKLRTIIIAILISVALSVLSRSQTPSISPTADRLVIHSEQFSAIQTLLDERTAHGYRVTNISYRTSIKNLNSKGRLEIALETTDAPGKYTYRALTTELAAQALARALSENGAQGYRLMKQTPIPLELGLARPRDMFVTVMEKINAAPASFAYRVVAYRHRLQVKDAINQALADGYVEVCVQQFGPVAYSVLEKASN